MSEVAFAKTFLAALDARPRKLSPDHVEDPRTFPARPPYILPRPPPSHNPMPKPAAAGGASGPGGAQATATIPGQEPSVSVTVRSLRPAATDRDAVRLSGQPLSTSLLDVRAAVAARLGLPPARIRLLHRKKPVADSKVLKDLVGPSDGGGGGGGTLELSVMIMGGGAVPPAAPAALATPAAAPAAVAGGEDVVGTTTAGGPTGVAVVEKPEFWDDLRGFLLQRVRDEKVTDELFSLFLRAWEERS